MKKYIYKYTVFGDYICPECTIEEFTTLSPTDVLNEFIDYRNNIKCKFYLEKDKSLHKTEYTFNKPFRPNGIGCDINHYNKQINEFIKDTTITDFQNSNIDCLTCKYDDLDNVINKNNKNKYLNKSICKLPTKDIVIIGNNPRVVKNIGVLNNTKQAKQILCTESIGGLITSKPGVKKKI